MIKHCAPLPLAARLTGVLAVVRAIMKKHVVVWLSLVVFIQLGCKKSNPTTATTQGYYSSGYETGIADTIVLKYFYNNGVILDSIIEPWIVDSQLFQIAGPVNYLNQTDKYLWVNLYGHSATNGEGMIDLSALDTTKGIYNLFESILDPYYYNISIASDTDVAGYSDSISSYWAAGNIKFEPALVSGTANLISTAPFSITFNTIFTEGGAPSLPRYELSGVIYDRK